MRTARRLLSLAALVAATSCIRTRADVQRDVAQGLHPAAFHPSAPPEAAPRRLAVRVWASEGHRQAVLGWEVRVFEVVKRANRLLAARFGVELEIVSMRPWDRPRDLSGLGAALFDLERHDPGDDADLVIGMVSPFGATASFHELGMARILGRHVVLRAMDDLAEFDALGAALDALSDDERQEVYAARLKHKEVAVLLHEVGHALGALHVRASNQIMHPTYDPAVRAFAEPNAELMARALEARGVGRRTEPARRSVKEAMVAYLERTEWAGWLSRDRAVLLALLTGDPERLAGATDARFAPDEGEGEVDPRRPPGPPPPPDPRQEIIALAEEGELDAAWRLLAPMLEAGGDDPWLLSVACQLAVRREASDAVSRCRRAAEASPEDPHPALMLAHALSETDREGAGAAAEEARRRLAEAEDPPPAEWGFLSAVYRRLDAVSRAEAAARRAEGDPDAAQTLAWAQRMRQTHRLPEDAAARGVPPAKEPDYLARRRRMRSALGQGDLEAARRAGRALAARYPKMPPPSVDLCEPLVNARAYREAVAVCGRARRAAPDAVSPRAGLAMAAFGMGRPGRAVAPLEEALELAPDRRGLWSLLAAAYRATGRRRALADLAARYRSRFDAPLR